MSSSTDRESRPERVGGGGGSSPVPVPPVARSRDLRLGSSFWLGMLVAQLPLVLLALSTWSEGPSIWDGDYAQYLLHAQALVQGEDYSDIGFIYTDYNNMIGPKAEPPGLPFSLYPVLKFWGRSASGWNLLMLLSSSVFLALAGVWLARRHSASVALTVVAISGIALYADGIVTLGSDAGFCAALWAVFVVSDHERMSPVRIATLSALACLAILYRLAGIALIPAFVLFGLLNFRRLRYRSFIPAVVCSILFLSVDWLLSMSGAVGSAMSLHPSDLWAVAVRNLQTYKGAVFTSTLYPFTSDILNDVYHLGACAILAIGAVLWGFERYRSLVFAFVVAYVGMLLVTPTRDARYLWPLFPMFALWLVSGAVWVLSRFVGVERRAEKWALALALVVAALGLSSLGSVYPRPPGLLDHPDTVALFDFLGRDGPSERRAVFYKPRVLTWETSIPAMGTFVAEPDEVISELRAQEITHVILGDFGVHGERTRSFREAVASCVGCFEVEFENDSFSVHRLRTESAMPALSSSRVGQGVDPGRVAPARNWSEAPPPVETCVIRSATPA